MKKETVSFEQTCPTIDYSFELITNNDSFYPDILNVRIVGSYREGSAGDNDAKFIRGIIETAIEIWKPKTLLLDLTQLNYKWGDYIDCIFNIDDQSTPMATVLGVGNRNALSTLINGIDSTEDIVDNEEFFDEIDKAINHLYSKM